MWKIVEIFKPRLLAIIRNKSHLKTMSAEVFESQKVKSVADGQIVELKSFWEDQSVAIVFFRRWGCMFCRLWAKELNQIAPVLKKHDIRLIGVGVDDVGLQEFVDHKFFDGDLYYVEKQETYKTLGFKHFNTVSILASLLWKQSRDAISKGKQMHLGGDTKGNWGQTGGALLVEKGGKLQKHFIQTGPADHLPNLEILKSFGLESEYDAGKMANTKIEDQACNTETKP